MRKSSTKLTRFEQYQPEESLVSINTERLNDLIEMSIPILDEISKIIREEDDRTVSVEMYNRITGAIDDLEELKAMY